MTLAAFVAAAALAGGPHPSAIISPQLGLPDGQVRIAVHAHGRIVDARFVGGVASMGKWLEWVRLLPAGKPDTWYTVLRAPGYYGTYPVQLKVDGKTVGTDQLLAIMPKHFERIPAWLTPEQVVEWWAFKNKSKVVSSSTWAQGYFTHRDVSLNRLVKVTMKKGGREATVYLSIARLGPGRPWRLVETVTAP